MTIFNPARVKKLHFLVIVQIDCAPNTPSSSGIPTAKRFQWRQQEKPGHDAGFLRLGGRVFPQQGRSVKF